MANPTGSKTKQHRAWPGRYLMRVGRLTIASNRDRREMIVGPATGQQNSAYKRPRQNEIGGGTERCPPPIFILFNSLRQPIAGTRQSFAGLNWPLERF